MSTVSAARPAITSALDADDESDAQHVVVVYNCSRIGLTANPPGYSLFGWLRLGRRRRASGS